MLDKQNIDEQIKPNIKPLVLEQIIPTKQLDPTRFTQAELDYLYNLGVKHFAVANYGEALPIFELLSKYQGGNTTYSKALAGCLQALQKYIEAFFYYQCTYLLDKKANHDCLFYSGVCLYEIHEQTKADEYFKEYLSHKDADAKLIAKAKLYHKLITDNQE